MNELFWTLGLGQPPEVLADAAVDGPLLRVEQGVGEEAHVVVASASCSDDHRWRFAALGVADFIEKPVGIRELERRVSALRARNGWGAQAVVESTVRGQGGVPRGERAAG